MDFNAPVGGSVNIRVYDYAGKVVLYQTEAVKKGKTILTSQLNDLAKGVYFVQVLFDKQSDFNYFDKIIKN